MADDASGALTHEYRFCAVGMLRPGVRRDIVGNKDCGRIQIASHSTYCCPHRHRSFELLNDEMVLCDSDIGVAPNSRGTAWSINHRRLKT